MNNNNTLKQYYERNNLLTINQDPKTSKGTSKGYITAIIYMAPASLSGKNVCSFSTAGCRAVCLNMAGRGQFNYIQQSRLNRTRYFLNDRVNFLNNLTLRISNFIEYAKRKELTPVIRLNGTSDIPYENIKIKLNDLLQYKKLNNNKHKKVFTAFIQKDGIKESLNIMDIFKNIQFYDYTKYPQTRRPNAIKQANYDLTFSRAENNETEALEYMRTNSGRASFVFSEKLPEYYKGFKVIDADKTDLRFLEPKNVITGLVFKGSKKTLKEGIKSGFVIPS
tara:strand:+ start:463 stop:1299 length:837 start_codon:yes stop_codon:yes gene_type:complete